MYFPSALAKGCIGGIGSTICVFGFTGGGGGGVCVCTGTQAVCHNGTFYLMHSYMFTFMAFRPEASVIKCVYTCVYMYFGCNPITDVLEESHWSADTMEGFLQCGIDTPSIMYTIYMYV